MNARNPKNQTDHAARIGMALVQVERLRRQLRIAQAELDRCIKDWERDEEKSPDSSVKALPPKAPRVHIKLHNPDNVRIKDIGKGYRFLTEEEFKKHQTDWATTLPDIEYRPKLTLNAWSRRSGSVAAYSPLNPCTTYRIPKK